MNEDKAKKLTIEIFKVILEEHNGYSPEEIKKNKLAEECEGSTMFSRIQRLIESKIK